MDTVVFDLDGTICEEKEQGTPREEYANVKPINNVIESMKYLKEKGCKIIIHTARHMKTCNNDVDKVKELVGDITIKWLEKHEVPYDELIFGKPLGDVYVDDRGINVDDYVDVFLLGKGEMYE